MFVLISNRMFKPLTLVNHLILGISCLIELRYIYLSRISNVAKLVKENRAFVVFCRELLWMRLAHCTDCTSLGLGLIRLGSPRSGSNWTCLAFIIGKWVNRITCTMYPTIVSFDGKPHGIHHSVLELNLIQSGFGINTCTIFTDSHSFSWHSNAITNELDTITDLAGLSFGALCSTLRVYECTFVFVFVVCSIC